MLSSAMPTRTRAVLSVVPELRQVVLRALHSGRPANAYGSPASPSSKFERPPPPHIGRPSTIISHQGEGAERSSRSPRRSERPSRGPSQTQAPSFGLRSPESSSNGRTAPTSSRRLAELPVTPKHAAFPSTAPAGKGRSKLDFMKSLPRPDASLTHSQVTAAKPHPFVDFPLNAALLESLPGLLSGDKSSVEPVLTTPIQSLSLSKLLETPSDALLAAETGSGKTLAYMLPFLHHLKLTDIPKDNSPSLPGVLANLDISSSSRPGQSDQLLPRSIIISPTHELTRQSTGVAKALSHGIKLSVLGMSSTKETAPGGGRKGVVDVLVGTSGGMRRMLGIKKEGEEFANRETARERRLKKDEEEDLEDGDEDAKFSRLPEGPRVGLEKVEWVIIDEADVLLGPSFFDETTQILSKLPSRTKIILCTATLPPSLLTALNSHPLLRTRDIPQLLAPGLHRLPSGLKTRFINDTGGHLAATVVKEVKTAFMEDAMEDRANTAGGSKVKVGKSRAVVFCNTDMRVREVARKFREKEPDLGVLEWTSAGEGRTRGSQGELTPFLQNQQKRSSTPRTAEAGVSSPRILITTSLLSRGLDFNEEVRTVVLVDPPKDTLDFVHRAGRTGRAGRSGRVIVFGMGDGVGGARGVQGRGGVGRGVAGVLRAGGRRG